MDLAATAARAVGLLDLTSLEAEDDAAKIEALCRRAVTPAGAVAALCIHAPFLPLARRLLAPGLRLATVANFPAGTGAPDAVAAEIRAAIAAGADEIDVVFPYAAFAAGADAAAEDLLAAARTASSGRTLKVILETGRLTPPLIRDAARLAIAAGADFLKSSTGKLQPAATMESARLLLEAAAASARPVGVKLAGGIRSTDQAAAYLALADEIMGPRWAAPATFRFGASALLDDLLAALGHRPVAMPSGNRY
jgi:deoxyribose-phosphate aldolase